MLFFRYRWIFLILALFFIVPSPSLQARWLLGLDKLDSREKKEDQDTKLQRQEEESIRRFREDLEKQKAPAEKTSTEGNEAQFKAKNSSEKPAVIENTQRFFKRLFNPAKKEKTELHEAESSELYKEDQEISHEAEPSELYKENQRSSAFDKAQGNKSADNKSAGNKSAGNKSADNKAEDHKIESGENRKMNSRFLDPKKPESKKKSAPLLDPNQSRVRVRPFDFMTQNDVPASLNFYKGRLDGREVEYDFAFCAFQQHEREYLLEKGSWMIEVEPGYAFLQATKYILLESSELEVPVELLSWTSPNTARTRPVCLYARPDLQPVSLEDLRMLHRGAGLYGMIINEDFLLRGEKGNSLATTYDQLFALCMDNHAPNRIWLSQYQMAVDEANFHIVGAFSKTFLEGDLKSPLNWLKALADVRDAGAWIYLSKPLSTLKGTWKNRSVVPLLLLFGQLPDAFVVSTPQEENLYEELLKNHLPIAQVQTENYRDSLKGLPEANLLVQGTKFQSQRELIKLLKEGRFFIGKRFDVLFEVETREKKRLQVGDVALLESAQRAFFYPSLSFAVAPDRGGGIIEMHLLKNGRVLENIRSLGPLYRGTAVFNECNLIDGDYLTLSLFRKDGKKIESNPLYIGPSWKKMEPELELQFLIKNDSDLPLEGVDIKVESPHFSGSEKSSAQGSFQLRLSPFAKIRLTKEGWETKVWTMGQWLLDRYEQHFGNKEATVAEVLAFRQLLSQQPIIFNLDRASTENSK